MKFPTTYSIETSRCRLRYVSKEDIPHIFSATRHEGFNDGMLWDPPESEKELIPPYEANMKAWEEDQGYCFSIEEKKTGDFIGRITIRKKEDYIWDLGFWTHPEKQKKGYMSEAALALMKFGFQELKALQITACHALWNKASERVLKKAGMRFIEYIPKGYQKNGKWVEENRLGVTRTEWESKQSVKVIPPPLD